MTPRAARASARRLITASGETITIRRVGTPNVDASVLAKVRGYRADELVGSIQQGDREIIALVEDVEAASYPTPIRERSTDVVIVRGAELTIQSVDDNTGLLNGTYRIRARG